MPLEFQTRFELKRKNAILRVSLKRLNTPKAQSCNIVLLKKNKIIIIIIEIFLPYFPLL